MAKRSVGPIEGTITRSKKWMFKLTTLPETKGWRKVHILHVGPVFTSWWKK